MPTPTDSQLETPERYAKALSDADSLAALRQHVAAFSELAKDALPIVLGMTDDDFTIWRKGLKLERRGTFAGMEFAQRFAAVMMPQSMFTVARIANEYGVPFAVALRRIRDVRPELLELRPAAGAVDPHVGRSLE